MVDQTDKPDVFAANVNRSDQSMAPRASKEYSILQHLSDIGYPVGPREIAQNLKINPNTVRARLSGLMDKGLISRPSWGKYLINIRQGMSLIGGGPRAQNVIVQVDAQVRESDEVRLELDRFLSLQIWFGMQRQRITYRVGVPYGLDVLGLVLVHHVVERELLARGYDAPPWDAWQLVDCEFFTDYNGFRLEGLQSATFSGMIGQLEKYYNKNGIRREVRVGKLKGVGLREIRTLLEGGVDAAQTHRRLDILEVRVEELTDAIKGGNRMVQATLEKALRDDRRTV